MKLTEIENAGAYLSFYQDHQEITEEINVLLERQAVVQQQLANAAQSYLELTDEEFNRLVFYFDSIAQDARAALGIQELNSED